ncbi:Gag protein [Colletotrichum scovillei]|nr:Gag protein [Colletotrichum scovillei]
MSSKTTPTSSKSGSGKGKTLAEELAKELDFIDVDSYKDGEVKISKEVYTKLVEMIKKNDNDIAQVQGMLNDTFGQLENKTKEAEFLAQRVNTLQTAANIVTTPLHGGRQKLKLNAPITYNGTLRILKGFLI